MDPSRRIHLCLSVSCCLALCFWFFFPSIYRAGDYIRQTNPFSGQREVERDFSPTPQELACLNGSFPPDQLGHSTPTPSAAEPIPNIVHFIFLQRLPSRRAEGDFGFLHYLAIRSAIVSLNPDAVYLHYGYISSPPSRITASRKFYTDKEDLLVSKNHWIQRLKSQVELKRYTKPLDGSIRHSAHVADTVRLELLLEHGGIYLDIDAFALRPFGRALNVPRPRSVLLGWEGGDRHGLCNAVIAARANSTFIDRWLKTYDHADLNREWNYHSVILPKNLAAAHPDEVCELPPDAFFWPTWTWRHITWMHEPLSDAEATHWSKRIEDTGGSLFDNQLVYHAWSQMARDRYLKRLTPDIIRKEDTRFNLMIRRFVEDDL
ncbi:hypothetical protein HIM_07238 [Hirsutella minnesotensis 3608]|uniref:Alpha 1,4-glycosyltransferase domain-containing protein n=1 Tax=Hirsutella minnesotensis 3608 TaxID=1043627 RepID=A0A0F8A4E6_9HYPO|nr:hypothetical protein HIM_07238 [Hirsutella minnesotensis 3608]